MQIIDSNFQERLPSAFTVLDTVKSGSISVGNRDGSAATFHVEPRDSLAPPMMKSVLHFEQDSAA